MNVWRRLRYLLTRRSADRDMQEELESLAAMAAPGELGNLTLAAENARAAQSWPRLDDFLRDLRHGARLTLRNPGFSAAIAAILAIGIGANAAIFAQLDAVAWTRLPVRAPNELRSLVWMGESPADPGVIAIQDSFFYAEYESMRTGNTSFADLTCWAPARFDRSVIAPGAGRIDAQNVCGSFFPMLGVAPVLGRYLTPEDDRAEAMVAVISYSLWQRAFGGDRSVLGKTLNANGRPFAIAGVMPPGFFGLDPSISPDAWLSIIADSGAALRNPRGVGVRVTGRLKPGVTDDRAGSETGTLFKPVPRPNSAGPRQVMVQEAAYGSGRLRNSTATYLRLMIAVTGAVLLIACANIAGLMLVRGAAREREFATRLALGAPRGRIMRQLITESLLLSIAGGAGAVALAAVLTPYFSGLLPRLLQTPFGQAQKLSVAARLDFTVLAFAGGITLAACLLFSIVPAVLATRKGLYSSMRVAGASRHQFASSKALVALQVALSVTLLVGAGMLVRTVINLRSVPLGYDPQGVVMVQIEPRFSGYSRERRNEFFEQAVRRLEQIPSVRSASGSSVSPIGGVLATLASAPGEPGLSFNSVGPRFFETWHWPLVAGREIEWSDQGTKRVALINQAFARRYFEGRDPVGAVFRQRADGDGWTILGVVADSKNAPRDKPLELLFPAFWHVAPWMTLAVRTDGEAAALVPAIRQVIAEIDPAVDILEVNIPARVRDASMNSELLFTGLMVTLGVLALSLCAIGLSGTLAYIVSRRSAEIGIRMALGARRADVTHLVVRESFWPVAAGVVVGIAVALIVAQYASQYAQRFLFGIAPHDPWSIAGAALVFLISAAAAAFLPAKRAARVDPMIVLRHE